MMKRVTEAVVGGVAFAGDAFDKNAFDGGGFNGGGFDGVRFDGGGFDEGTFDGVRSRFRTTTLPEHAELRRNRALTPSNALPEHGRLARGGVLSVAAWLACAGKRGQSPISSRPLALRKDCCPESGSDPLCLDPRRLAPLCLDPHRRDLQILSLRLRVTHSRPIL